jgi:hypothetical protein
LQPLQREVVRLDRGALVGAIPVARHDRFRAWVEVLPLRLELGFALGLEWLGLPGALGLRSLPELPLADQARPADPAKELLVREFDGRE